MMIQRGGYAVQKILQIPHAAADSPWILRTDGAQGMQLTVELLQAPKLGIAPGKIVGGHVQIREYRQRIARSVGQGFAHRPQLNAGAQFERQLGGALYIKMAIQELALDELAQHVKLQVVRDGVERRGIPPIVPMLVLEPFGQFRQSSAPLLHHVGQMRSEIASNGRIVIGNLLAPHYLRALLADMLHGGIQLIIG